MEPFQEKLTEREQEILARLAHGLSDQQIADELFLSLNTVKWYNRQIYGKLGVSRRTQAIARARELRLYGGETADAPDHIRDHLPAELNSFIGRKREVAEIQSLLQENRLVTLVGPPGMGKTRLSLQVSRGAIEAFPDGVYFVPLAPIQAVENMLWAITDRLDFQLESRGVPLEQLQNHLRKKKLLLVLDNFEHLMAGAGLLPEILSAAPGVKMLVTSRERLGLYGEMSYLVGGMVLPGEEQQGGDRNASSDHPPAVGEDAQLPEAVQLFFERAKAVDLQREWSAGDLRQIAKICRLVEGMPLAIELAAAWVDTLRPEEIAGEIERDIDILELERQDVPQNQRSIRAAFYRSWNLLDEAQAEAFRRLSVFRGGLTREAAGSVAGVGLRTLHALVNKSLLRHQAASGRYDIHELLRYYAGEQLEQSGEAEAVRRAHAAYFAGFMAGRWPMLKDRRQRTALQEIREDLANVRTAWGYWLEKGDAAQLMKFLHSFWVFYDIQGWYPAGIDLFEQAVRVLQEDPAEEAQACVGWLLAVQGLFSIPVEDYDYDQGISPPPLEFASHGSFTSGAGPQKGFALAQKGMQILRGLRGYQEMKIIPLISLFLIASRIPEGEAISRQAARECLEIATEIGDRWAIAKAKQFLAVMAIEAGEYEQAGPMAHEALAAFQASGDHWSISVVCIEVLGLLDISQRRFDSARAWIRRGLQAAEEIDFKYSIQTAFWQLGFIAALEENYAEAGSYWRKALAVSDRMLGGRGFLGFGSRAGSRGQGANLGARKPAPDRDRGANQTGP